MPEPRPQRVTVATTAAVGNGSVMARAKRKAIEEVARNSAAQAARRGT